MDEGDPQSKEKIHMFGLRLIMKQYVEHSNIIKVIVIILCRRKKNSKPNYYNIIRMDLFFGTKSKAKSLLY